MDEATIMPSTASGINIAPSQLSPFCTAMC
jgi:hypothetical protein